MRTKTTEIELKTARRKLGLNKVEMARRLATPYRTYQDWEGGRRSIPGVVAVAVELLIQRDAIVMQAIIEKIDRDLGGSNVRKRGSGGPAV